MTTVLAAIDNSAASKPVLETAAVLAECIDATIEALHITEGAHGTASAAAQAAIKDTFSPMSDMRGSLDYRSRVASNLLERFRLERDGETVEVMAL